MNQLPDPKHEIHTLCAGVPQGRSAVPESLRHAVEHLQSGPAGSGYAALALARRGQLTPDGRPACNCCQAVVSVFARDAGYDEEASMKAATYFRGGMQLGSVCGAITGSLMALGLAGLDDPLAAAALYQKIRERHDGMLNCRDLLRISAEKGEAKLAHCNALICECIGYVEELLRSRGKLQEAPQ